MPQLALDLGGPLNRMGQKAIATSSVIYFPDSTMASTVSFSMVEQFLLTKLVHIAVN